eukprot:9146005-Pyramimonas_sp.AAC.1
MPGACRFYPSDLACAPSLCQRHACDLCPCLCPQGTGLQSPGPLAWPRTWLCLCYAICGCDCRPFHDPCPCERGHEVLRA